MKLLRTICVIGIALCLVTSVYAGTQSVKISGDLTIRGLFRNNYDLDHHHDEGMMTSPVYIALPGTENQLLYIAPTSDWDTYFMTTTELQVDADLTDNVSAVIRLFNQRDWNRDVHFQTPAWRNTWGAWEASTRVDQDNAFDVGIDLAYVELKEFLYSPLTVRVGRQDLWFGKGFIVGRNQQNPHNAISAPEYTCVESFDSIRTTLDYDPWTIDGIAAKISEGNIGDEDDSDLFGANIGYIFDVYNAEMEAYWFWKNDAASVIPYNVKDHNSVHTLGLRGSADPIEDWTIAAEGAIQVGTYVGFEMQMENRARRAWAIDLSAECRYFRDTFAWKPVLSGEYIFYSGDGESNPDRGTAATYRGWDPMYRGKFDSAIREFYGTYYNSMQALCTMNAAGPAAGQQSPDVTNPEASYTNQHQIALHGAVQPTDSLLVQAKYLAFWQAEHRNYCLNWVPAARVTNVYEKRDLYIGSEVDLMLTWDYTEDVQFDLLAAWFWPGDVYTGSMDDTATDVVGSMKLSF